MLRVFSQQGVIAVGNGYRIKDHLRTEYGAIVEKSGAASAILADIIPPNPWLVTVEGPARCINLEQDRDNFRKAGGDDPTQGVVKSKVRFWYQHVSVSVLP